VTGWAMGLGLALAAALGWSARDAERAGGARAGLRVLRAAGGCGLAALALLAVATGSWAGAAVAAAATLVLWAPALAARYAPTGGALPSAPLREGRKIHRSMRSSTG
jgi:hypothetical protein